jgi:uncharacterized spore protein YtfJ
VDVEKIIGDAKDSITVRRVFGEPYEKDGITIIPAAAIGGGAGGGHGEAQAEGGTGTDTGSGFGFGLSGRPVGAFVIKDGRVEWQPATDPTRIMLGWQFVGIVALFSLRTMYKARAKRRS